MVKVGGDWISGQGKASLQWLKRKLSSVLGTGLMLVPWGHDVLKPLFCDEEPLVRIEKVTDAIDIK